MKFVPMKQKTDEIIKIKSNNLTMFFAFSSFYFNLLNSFIIIFCLTLNTCDFEFKIL